VIDAYATVAKMYSIMKYSYTVETFQQIVSGTAKLQKSTAFCGNFSISQADTQ